MKTTITSTKAPLRKKQMLLYARVSTEEQTKGTYPSCDSQVEELEAECVRRGWDVYRIIKDEGYSAGSMRRPGLTEARMMVQSGEINGIICTWYDRLTRSREFYILDHEFKTHNVEFVTLHDAADTRTAAGRFMESMIVAAKTYDRDQTSEKVRIKMRMRQEKGLHQGGLVPFGFTVDAEKMLHPNPEQTKVLEQIFQVYVETSSDFAVRDWLKAHGISAPHGGAVWQVSSIHDLLTNRRYIAEIEINRKNKGLEDLSPNDSYRVVKAPHKPLISVELFALAQAIRKEKARKSPNRVGKPRSYSTSKCGRVNILQGTLLCGVCGHAMAPHYTVKQTKAQEQRAYVHYYVCAPQIKAMQEQEHKNRVPAKVSEAWIFESVQELIASENIIERAVEEARRAAESDLSPQKEALALNRAAMQENQAKIDQMLETISSGQATGALFAMLNERAAQLKLEREQLRIEQRRLTEALSPLQERFDVTAFRQSLVRFSELAQIAQPNEVQQLLRLMVRRVEWVPEGPHRMQFYYLPKPHNDKEWFATNVRSDGPDRCTFYPLLYRLRFLVDSFLPKLESNILPNSI